MSYVSFSLLSKGLTQCLRESLLRSYWGPLLRGLLLLIEKNELQVVTTKSVLRLQVGNKTNVFFETVVEVSDLALLNLEWR